MREDVVQPCQVSEKEYPDYMPKSLHNLGLAGGPPKFYTIVETPNGSMLVGTCVRGISRSVDGGTSWQPVGELEHVSVNTLAIESDGCLLAATSGGLWRSEDDGSTWTLLDREPVYAVLPDGTDRPPGMTTLRLCRLADGRTLAGTEGEGIWICDAGEWIPLGLAGSIVYSLLETTSGALLAGTRGEGVVRSDDRGTTWTPSNVSLPDVYVHCLLELGDGSVLAGVGLGIARSIDDGNSWGPYAAELHGHRVFAVCELADGRVAAGSYAHMWIGLDETWGLVDPGLTPDESWSVLFGDHGEIYAGTKAGVLRSDDGGDSWRNVAPGSVVFSVAKTAAGEILAGGDGGVHVGPDWHPVGDIGLRVYTVFEVARDNLLAGTISEERRVGKECRSRWSPYP